MNKFYREIKYWIEIFIETFLLYMTMLLPRNKKMLIFGAWFGDKFDDNSKFLFQYACNYRADLKAIWITPNPKVLNEIQKAGLPVCDAHSLKAVFLSLRAKFCITTTASNGGDLGYHLKKYMGGAVFVNLWHGIPLKKIVFDDEFAQKKILSSKSKFVRAMQSLPFRNSYYIATSEEIVKRYLSCFKTDYKHVLNLGQARNDYFYEPHSNMIRNLYLNKKIVVYMPTHRQEGKVNMEIYKHLNFAYLNKFCKERGLVFLIKKHYYHRQEKEPLDNLTNILDITNDDYSSQEILDAADILITDYSSCYIDHLLLDRPQLFFCYDYSDYISSDRGLYEEYSSNVTGPLCYTEERLLEELNLIIGGNDIYKELRNQKRDFYHSKENQCPVANKQLETILSL